MNSLLKIKEIIKRSIEVKENLLNDETVLKQTDLLGKAIVDCLKKGNKVILAGNGGSASDAMHIAGEFVSRLNFDRGPLAAVAICTNDSVMTAISNDYGYEYVFSRQVKAIGRNGDVFIGITTSGKSKNILFALHEAKSMGMHTAIFMGNAVIDEIELECDFPIHVPATETARIQESHILLGHAVCDVVEKEIFGER